MNNKNKNINVNFVIFTAFLALFVVLSCVLTVISIPVNTTDYSEKTVNFALISLCSLVILLAIAGAQIKKDIVFALLNKKDNQKKTKESEKDKSLKVLRIILIIVAIIFFRLFKIVFNYFNPEKDNLSVFIMFLITILASLLVGYIIRSVLARFLDKNGFYLD